MDFVGELDWTCKRDLMDPCKAILTASGNSFNDGNWACENIAFVWGLIGTCPCPCSETCTWFCVLDWSPLCPWTCEVFKDWGCGWMRIWEFDWIWDWLNGWDWDWVCDLLRIWFCPSLEICSE